MPVPNINLSQLNNSQGFIIRGVNQYEYSGFSVSNAGDINGDGFDDIIIGAPQCTASNSYSYYVELPDGCYDDASNDRTYVVFGNSEIADSGILELSQLNGSNGFVINGSSSYDRLGDTVSNAGDLNGDGFDDIIIGAPDVGYNVGESYIIFGKNRNFPANLELTRLNGRNGFTITNNYEYDVFSNSVSNAGDINGDGIDDVIIGTPNGGKERDNNGFSSNEGESYVVFGSTNIGNPPLLDIERPDGNNGFVINGIDPSDKSGSSVSNAGDINGDGIDDVIVGAPDADFGNTSSRQGESYVVFGNPNIGNTGSLELSELNGSNGFIIQGARDNRFTGRSVSGAGDLNGDGIDDVIINGSFVIFGSRDTFQKKLNLANLDGNNGFTIFGDGIGSNAGDVNGDSIDDVIVSRGSNAYVLFGRSNGFTANLNLADIDDNDGFLISGSNTISSVSGAGDFNGDGFDDVVIGASGADLENSEYGNEGESYLIFGFATSETNEFIGTRNNDRIIGSSGRDRILGGAGNDSLIGSGGDDLILGQKDDDRIAGSGGNDTLIGGNGNDLVIGKSGADELLGNNGLDRLLGGSGNDTLIGGKGNDNLNGGSNNDFLIGVDSRNTNSTFGIGELDILTGGRGNDTFVLGNSDRIFYDDENDLTTGEEDFVLITDFDASRDRIQLQGSADFYSLEFLSSGENTIDAKLIYNSGTFAVGETIAVLENVNSNLSLEDSAFTFL